MSTNTDAVQKLTNELASMTRMFHAACADLGAINEALGLDPDDGGAEPILEAIAELKAAKAASGTAKEVIGYVPSYIIDEWKAGRNIHVHVSRAQTVDHDMPIYAAPDPSTDDQS